MTETMKAAVVTAEGVKVQQAPRPVPGPEQVLVRVRAAGLNRADLGVAAGHAHGRMGTIGMMIMSIGFLLDSAQIGLTTFVDVP